MPGIARSLWTAALIGCPLLSVSAQPPPTTGSIDSLVEELSTGSFSSRQQATLKMWRGREQSRQSVQQAARHPDPEVSGRANWILRQWRRGAVPGTPPEVSRLLASSQGGAAIDRLLVEGQFDAALVAIEESAGTLEHEAIRQRVAALMQRQFPICVRAAIKHDRIDRLLEFVDTVADSKEMAVCRIQLMQQLGLDMNNIELLPSAAESWPQAQRDEAETLVLILLGRNAQAVQVAEQSGSEDLLSRTLRIVGRWAAATEVAAAAARQTTVASPGFAEKWSMAMICADRAGDDDVFHAAADALEKTQATDQSGARELAWKTLAIHGQIEPAIEIARQVSREDAATLAIDAVRTDQAFQIIGLALTDADQQILSWCDEAIARQQAAQVEDLVQPVVDLFLLIKCLLTVGREDTARAAVERLCRADVKVGSLALREYVLSMLLDSRRSDWVLQYALPDGAESLTSFGRTAVAQEYANGDPLSLEIVIAALGRINPTQSPPDRLIDACALLDGQLPAAFDPASDFRRLFDFASAPKRRIPGARVRAIQEIRANMQIVELFSRHGQTDYASRCLLKLIDSGDIEALRHLAEQELDAGSVESAAALFDQLYESVSNERSLTRFGNADGGVIAVQSMIGAWTIAKRMGDAQRAEQALREIRLAICSPSTDLRTAVAKYLAERNESELAIEMFEHLLPMVVMGNDQQTSIHDVARGYALLTSETQPGAAARWFDFAVCKSVHSSRYPGDWYIKLPLYVKRLQVEDALKANDLVAMRTHLDRLIRLNPLDITVAESLLPRIRSAGMDDLADQTFDQIFAAGTTYADQFAQDAMTSNNLAWVAAMNHRRLDEALRLAERAVFQEPESAIYRDTLAEVLFLLGRNTEALQIEESCLLDDPTQWHLHQQIKKYRQALQPAP